LARVTRVHQFIQGPSQNRRMAKIPSGRSRFSRKKQKRLAPRDSVGTFGKQAGLHISIEEAPSARTNRVEHCIYTEKRLEYSPAA